MFQIHSNFLCFLCMIKNYGITVVIETRLSKTTVVLIPHYGTCNSKLENNAFLYFSNFGEMLHLYYNNNMQITAAQYEI